MNIVQMRRGMGKGGGTPLPYTSQVEFLQSNGKQFIDTGVLGTNVYGLDFSFQPVSYVKNYQQYISSKQDDFTVASPGSSILAVYVRLRTAQLANPVSVLSSEANRLYTEAGTIFINNSWSHSYTSPIAVNPINIHIFGVVGSNRFSAMRFYYLKLYGNNSTLLFDGIPVRVDNKGAVYDRVSEQLIYSGYTPYEEFYIGPDVQ